MTTDTTQEPAETPVRASKTPWLIAFTIGAFVAMVQSLWNSLQKEFTVLPRLTYSRAMVLVSLWGLIFVIVLTMISGARELMTPDAWTRQGWTYNVESRTPVENN